MARCPAHPDKTASLSIRELDDGRVLVHDFAGCSVEAVLDALGMELADLFEKPLESKGSSRDRGHWHAMRAALECLRAEAQVIVIAASDVSGGKGLSSTDADRVARAAGRIYHAVEVLYGR